MKDKYKSVNGRKTNAEGFMTSSKTPDPPRPEFCVSVKRTDTEVMVRDTKDDSKTTLTFSHDEWNAFLQGAKDGEFDI